MGMQYKDFVWPNDPRTYTLSFERQTVVQKIPMGSFTAQDLGLTCMVLRGEGEFFGKKAMEQFRALTRVFQSGGAGVLLHPAWHGGQALFTQLRMTQEPREDYAAYQFEFCQSTPQETIQTAYVTSRRGRGGRIYYTVANGETAWQICTKQALTMQELMEMNPELASPTGLTAGQRVRVQ